MRALVSYGFALAVTAGCVIIGGEVFLRLYPQAMPYPQTWNYVRSYEDLSRIVRGKPPLFRDARIVAFGDSFTRGAEVAPGQDWIARLNADRGYRIFNYGIGGSSTVEQVTVSQGMVFQPTVEAVLLVIFRNDIESNVDDLVRLETEGPTPFFRRFIRSSDIGSFDECRTGPALLRSECLYFRSYFIAAVVDTYRQWTEGEAFQKTVDVSSAGLVWDPVSKRYTSARPDVSEFRDADDWLNQRVEAIAVTVLMVERLRDHLAAKDVRLAVAYLPSVIEVYAADWAERQGVAIDTDMSVGAVLAPHIENLGLPFLDVTPHLRKVRKSRAPLYLKLDGHPSPGGHAAIAEAMDGFLSGLGLGSAPRALP
jgi:hypothetical protein